MTRNLRIILLLCTLSIRQSVGRTVPHNTPQPHTEPAVETEPTEPLPEQPEEEEVINESAGNFKETKARGIEMGAQQQGIHQQHHGKAGNNQQQGLQQQLVAVIGGKPYVLQQQLAQQQQLLKDKKGKVSGVQQNQGQQQQAVADQVRTYSDSNNSELVAE